MKAVFLTADQRDEVNDAINEVVSRMLTVGQTTSEIEHASLRALWSAWQSLTAAEFGDWKTPGMLALEPAVTAAIKQPKKHAAPAAYDRAAVVAACAAAADMGSKRR